MESTAPARLGSGRRPRPPKLLPEWDADPARVEEYLVLLLSDSNLPTGGFVASSGLESFIQHGYLSASSSPEQGLVEFVKSSLDNYAHANGPIVARAFAAVDRYRHSPALSFLARLAAADKPTTDDERDDLRDALDELYDVDRLCDEMILNAVARRASIAQGHALLSLYSRALAPAPDRRNGHEIARLVERVREEVKQDAATGAAGQWKGHQSTSFGIVMSAVGLSLDRALHLFLFLHARSILSSAVRLNVIGPYSAHRLLLWDVRDLVERVTAATTRAARSAPGDDDECKRDDGDDETDFDDEEYDDDVKMKPTTKKKTTTTTRKEEDWWDDDEKWAFLNERNSTRGMGSDPVTTWPLGEIIASRHDQLFTKVFNS
ncbi:hypothetical protein JCM11491_005790 [Sporobolomyces phaffii]